MASSSDYKNEASAAKKYLKTYNLRTLEASCALQVSQLLASYNFRVINPYLSCIETCAATEAGSSYRDSNTSTGSRIIL